MHFVERRLLTDLELTDWTRLASETQELVYLCLLMHLDFVLVCTIPALSASVSVMGSGTALGVVWCGSLPPEPSSQPSGLVGAHIYSELREQTGPLLKVWGFLVCLSRIVWDYKAYSEAADTLSRIINISKDFPTIYPVISHGGHPKSPMGLPP